MTMRIMNPPEKYELTRADFEAILNGIREAEAVISFNFDGAILERLTKARTVVLRIGYDAAKKEFEKWESPLL